MTKSISSVARRPRHKVAVLLLPFVLLIGACGSSSSSSKGTSGSGPTTTSGGSSTATTTAATGGSGGSSLGTGADICKAFPVSAVASASGLTLDKSEAGGTSSSPHCSYANSSDAMKPTVQIGASKETSLATTKQVFSDGHTVSGVGDDAWYNALTAGAGTLYVLKGNTVLALQVTATGATPSYTDAQILAMDKALATLALQKV